MSGSTKKLRVLIVDDERVIADTLATIFRNAGYDAMPLYSAEQALEVIHSGGWVPHLAILDVHLPLMNGIDLAVHLKAVNPACKLTLFSGQSSSAELIEGARAQGHIFEVLGKPVHPTTLLDLASTIVAPSEVDDLPPTSCFLADLEN